jgi:hypothetical protein
MIILNEYAELCGSWPGIESEDEVQRNDCLHSFNLVSKCVPEICLEDMFVKTLSLSMRKALGTLHFSRCLWQMGTVLANLKGLPLSEN